MLSPSQCHGSVCGQRRVCAHRPHVHVVWPSAMLLGHLCPNLPLQSRPAGWGAAPAPCQEDHWGAGWLLHGVKEQERVRQCCRNAFWTRLPVTRENHKVREVIKAIHEKLGFIPNLGIVGASFFFSCRPERGAHLLFIHCHPAFCTTVHALIHKEEWET